MEMKNDKNSNRNKSTTRAWNGYAKYLIIYLSSTHLEWLLR